jgi:hypothetical protein
MRPVLVVDCSGLTEWREVDRGGGDRVKLIERIPARYEVEEVEDLGQLYRWCPEKAVVECDACGKRTTFKRSSLITSILTCECGARSTAGIREELLIDRLPQDEIIHPWRYWQSKETAGIPI